MFQHFADFCRRVFSSRSFRRGFRIFLGVFIVYYIYNLILFFIAVRDSGATFGEALRFLLESPLIIPPSASVALGIAIGLIWYFNRRNKSDARTEPDEKAEESSNAAQEEDFIETKHYRYQ